MIFISHFAITNCCRTRGEQLADQQALFQHQARRRSSCSAGFHQCQATNLWFQDTTPTPGLRPIQHIQHHQFHTDLQSKFHHFSSQIHVGTAGPWKLPFWRSHDQVVGRKFNCRWRHKIVRSRRCCPKRRGQRTANGFIITLLTSLKKTICFHPCFRFVEIKENRGSQILLPSLQSWIAPCKFCKFHFAKVRTRWLFLTFCKFCGGIVRELFFSDCLLFATTDVEGKCRWKLIWKFHSEIETVGNRLRSAPPPPPPPPPRQVTPCFEPFWPE